MIRLDREDGLWIVTLDRPDRKNALTAGMLTDLVGILKIAGEARALILTGTGDVFSAGADLDEVRAGTLARNPLWEEVSGLIAEMSCVTVAALNGTLAGGAFGMALACDMRLGVEGAQFFYPVIKLGVLPQPSDPARLAALVGPARAKLLLLAGQRWTADEALDAGLLDGVFARADLMDRARDLCAGALAAPTGHAGAIKALF